MFGIIVKSKKFIVAQVLACSVLGGWSQVSTGSVKGVVSDATSKETLIGCVVWIDGGSQSATTDLNGAYVIKKLKPGNYKLNVSYISYQKKSVAVTVVADREHVIDVELEPETIQMEQAVVIGRRKTETDAVVMQSIKASDVAMNGVSSQMITKTQDKDAAEVLKKIPGITITDGRFVVVRGLTERYNSVLLNGASAPSFESDSRAFSFDVIPSNMISNIQIMKAPAPEIPADFAGAAIKITTKNDAINNSLKVSLSGGFVQNVTGRCMMLDRAGQGEWLGYDNATKSLSSSFPSTDRMNDLASKSSDETAEEKALETPELESLTRSMSAGQQWVPTEGRALPPVSASVFLTRSFKAGKTTIGNITTLNYGVGDNRTETDRQFINVEQGLTDYQYRDTAWTRSVKAGVIHNWQWVLPGGHKIEFRNFVNQMGNSKFTRRNGTNFADNNTIIRYEDTKYESRFIYNGQLAGTHELREGATKIDWLGGYSYTMKNTPNERRFLWEKDTATGKYVFQLKPSPDPFVGSCYYQQLQENMQNAALNLEHRFDILQNGKPWTLRVGLFYEGKQREFWLRNLGYTIGGPNDNIDMTAPIDSIMQAKNYYELKSDTTLGEDKFRNYYYKGKLVKRVSLGRDTLVNNRYGIMLKENTFPQDAYKATTTLAAAYLGLKIPMGSFSFYGGARVEQYSKLIYDFYQANLSSEAKDTMNIKSTEVDIFPSVNVTYNLSKTMLLRLSYGKTINRPELREVASFSYNNFEDKTFVIGNPRIKSCKVDNYDLRWEWYPTETELISLSTFYKHFRNPIEISFASNKGSGITLVPENTPEATSTGVEVDVRKSLVTLENNPYFWYLKHITLVMNASLIKSLITTTQETAREKHRPMQGQSPYIVNLGAYYQGQKGTMVSLMYNRIGKRIVFAGNDKTPHYWELPYNSLDLTMGQKINKMIEVKLGVKDLVAGKQRIVLYEGQVDKGTQHNVQSTNRNRTFSIGATMTF